MSGAPPLGAAADLVDRLTGWRALAAAFAAGVVSVLAHAPFHVVPAMAVGLVALVLLLDGAWRLDRGRAQAAFARGWAFAFGYFLAGCYWIGSAFLQVEGAAILMPFAMAALPAGLALFWGAACAAMMPAWTEDARRIPLFAAGLMVAELARGHLFTGFPWNLPGTVWVAGGPISQIASVVGVYGLSALTLLALAAPAALADARRGFGLRAAPALIAALGFGLAWGWGAQRLETADRMPIDSDLPIVRVVDPGLTQKEKWEVGADAVFDAYLALTDDPESEAEVVLWPEGAVPTYLGEPPLIEDPDRIEALGAALGDRVLIVGTVRVQPAPGGEPAVFNSAVVLDGVGGAVRLGQIADKHHLVPFGEYMPFWSLYSSVPIAPLQMIGKGFTPGPRPERLIVPGAPMAVVLICYESIFPGYTPRGESRPGWIAMLTNDAWFGGQTGPWQHWNQSRYRAIEEGLPVARAAAGGVSGISDAYGRVVRATPISGGAAEAALPSAAAETPFARWGFLLMPALILLIAAIRVAPPGGPARGLKS